MQDIITKDTTQYNISMKRYSIIASGRVQGVGFRAYVQEIAEEMDISGWVRNLSNGTVECEAEGDDEQITRFINRIANTKETFIKVNNIVAQQISTRGSSGFFIKRD